MKQKIISIIFYMVSALFLLVYLLADLSSYIMLSEFGRLFLLCGGCLFLYFGGVFLSKYRKDNKPMKINLWIFFFLYCLLLITLTLFDPSWGRNGFNSSNWTEEGFSYYIESSVNLIPFKTIIGYMKDLFTSLLDTSNIFFNLFGNLVCLMPLALFIPMLFKRVNNSKRFVISILCITFGIELIQFITFTGSCDVDDIILNTLGALIMYKILHINDVSKLIKNIFVLEKNKINKKKILLVLLSLLVVVILCFCLYKISSKYYDNNLDEFISKRNYKIEIIDETENCDQALEKFYENELYEYYFSCIKSDYVYARINDGKKYLVKDLLNNNPTDYVIYIDKLKRAGLEFIVKEKYEKINVAIDRSNVYTEEKIENERILDIGYGESGVSSDEMSYGLYLIPKMEGETLLTINVYNGFDDELLETKKYQINVDSELKVYYEEIK